MNNEQFSSALLFSFLGHLALVFFAVLNIFFFKDKVTRLETAVRVDLVGLPDKPQEVLPVSAPVAPPTTVPPLVEAKPDLPTKPVEAPKPKVDESAVNLEQVKKKQKQALEKLKQQSAIEKLQEQLKKETTVKNEVKGNIIADGGDVKGIDKIQFDQYYSAVDRHIRQYWSLPPFLKGRGLKALVVVKIDSSGKVISTILSESSGNSQFDEIVIATANEASPVPAPPEKFQRVFLNQGFSINFKE